MFPDGFWPGRFFPPQYFPKTGGAGHGHGTAAGRRFMQMQALLDDARNRRATKERFNRLAAEIGAEEATEQLYHRLRADAEKSFQQAMNRRSAYTVLVAEM